MLMDVLKKRYRQIFYRKLKLNMICFDIILAVYAFNVAKKRAIR